VGGAVSRHVVCISRELGADGEHVGRLVAEELGLRYVDEDVIALAAERGGVPPGVIADTEDRKSRLLRVLELLSDSGSVSGYVATETASMRARREQSYRELIRAVIEEVAGQGDAVIVAHAASLALAGRDGVLRVFVTGSPDSRTKRIATAESIDEKEAAKLVKQGDAARADYVKRFYAVDRELPIHYDLIVNTDELGAEGAAAVVARAAGVGG
jgi:cytidylate kinase